MYFGGPFCQSSVLYQETYIWSLILMFLDISMTNRYNNIWTYISLHDGNSECHSQVTGFLKSWSVHCFVK